MWIVRVALNRPYTFIVLALLILILSPVMILRTPTDIFPNIKIPIAAVIWRYAGLLPEERAQIRRLESQHLPVGRQQPFDLRHRRAGAGTQYQFLRLIKRDAGKPGKI